MHIRRDGATKTFSPVLAAGAYASGDVLFQPLEITDVSLDTKGASVLRTISVLDKAEQKQAIDLLFFSEDPGDLGANTDALAMSDAEFASFLGRVSIAAADFVSASANADATKLLEMLLITKSKQRSVWVVGVCRSGTPTYGVDGLTFKLHLERY